MQEDRQVYRWPSFCIDKNMKHRYSIIGFSFMTSTVCLMWHGTRNINSNAIVYKAALMCPTR